MSLHLIHDDRSPFQKLFTPNDLFLTPVALDYHQFIDEKHLKNLPGCVGNVGPTGEVKDFSLRVLVHIAG